MSKLLPKKIQRMEIPTMMTNEEFGSSTSGHFAKEENEDHASEINEKTAAKSPTEQALYVKENKVSSAVTNLSLTHHSEIKAVKTEAMNADPSERMPSDEP
ncbi:unnamed protein product [Dovyalis caffra]|uniref:Uncharacterized protein n=1 Tax=Dovyalis caffra TaxID=77055 RepID=A0AAV1SH82_9ROSI|nr:unnamed protein product [Dovyalis caffra]